jgi:hypothetical protein
MSGSNNIYNTGAEAIAVALENNEFIALRQLHLQNNFVDVLNIFFPFFVIS